MQPRQGRRETSPRLEADSESVARRLDRLSRRDVERVLERAIRIQAQRHASDTLTIEQVKGIARELGLDESIIDDAIGQELSGREDEEGEGRLLPRRLVESRIVSGSPEEVTDNIMSWMEAEEGLQPVARLPDGIRWVPDKRWLTSARLAFGSAGTKAMRQVPEVIHHQRPLGGDRQVVELWVPTGRVRATAWGVGGGLGGLGVAGGVLVAALVPVGNDLLQFTAAAVPGLAAGAAGLVVIAKAWAGSLRRGMRRALEGIAHPELHRRRRRLRGVNPNMSQAAHHDEGRFEPVVD